MSSRYAAFAKPLPEGWRPQIGEVVYVFGPAACATVLADLGLDVFKVRTGGLRRGRFREIQKRLDEMRPVPER